MSTFVSLGNARQPFRRLLEYVDAHAGELPQPVTVQCGHTLYESPRLRCIPFLRMDEFEAQIAQAELLIHHAGVGTTLLAVRAGKMPIVVPRRTAFGEHVDDHQLEAARALAASGHVLVAENPADIAALVPRALELQRRQRAQAPSGKALVAEIDRLLTDYARFL